jgi:predicted DNA-binding transcriptional regulator AlpA
MNNPVLTGKKRIAGFCGRSWATILEWIKKDNFPARKLSGVWESDESLIIAWRRDKIIENSKTRELI